ncbi:hypothetical protein GKC30_09965 [Pseudodesulfovibrio sp. F-1]|uniref:Uncharacterized protein n=1 Tax=Pseudodesulfovibrio alkaliphilus TaxID=2661613 RepID=A0A7K1KPE0_9BACT|nr:hypothetical protein [Pseudodesulfovibrio alkaliphilus]MUM77959.1 hypothetical protein [Pseudodesulfovibrio alkaliphilus]
MSTQSIDSNGYGYSYQQLLKARQEAEAAEKAQAQLSGSTSYSSGTSMSQVREYVESLLANIPKSNGNKLTFQDVYDYRDSHKKEWSERFEEDMQKLGVDTSIEIKLSLNGAKGTVTAQNGHPDKAVIDKYFVDNPEMAEKFEEGVQLSKLTGLTERKLTSSELRQQLSLTSMSIWFESNTSASSLFSGGGMVLGQEGVSAYTGLNLTV